MTSITTEAFDASYDIPATNYSRLQWEIAKLNKVCAKIGVAPIELTVTGTTTVRVLDTNTSGGVERTRQVYTVRVVGSKPKMSGWSLVARLEHLGTGTLVCAVPGHEVPESYWNAPCHCDHCRTQRNRRDTFVLYNQDVGYRQIGLRVQPRLTIARNPAVPQPPSRARLSSAF